MEPGEAPEQAGAVPVVSLIRSVELKSCRIILDFFSMHTIIFFRMYILGIVLQYAPLNDRF